MDTFRNRPTERNPKTLARFRRESWWQITFPMIVVVVLLLGGVAGLYLWRGSKGVSVVADYSLILMIIPMLVVGLVGLGVVIGLMWLVAQAMNWIPPYTYIAQRTTFDIRDRVSSVAKRITGVIIGFRSFLDGILRFLRQRGYIPEVPQDTTPGDAGRKS